MNKYNLPKSLAFSHQNNFNFLRLLFSSLVLLSHSTELIDGDTSREILMQFFGSTTFGQLAVDGFFLLSGYLIVKSWKTTPSAKTFLWKRIVRIYPGFIAASLISGIIVGPLGSIPKTYFSQFWITGFAKGLVLLQSPITPQVFVGQPHAVVNGSMWTISYEFICYLFVFAIGVSGGLKTKWIWLLLTYCLLQILFLDRAGYYSAEAFCDSNVLKNLLRLSPFFLVGGCFYLFKEKIVFNPIAGVFSMLIFVTGLFSPLYSELFIALFGGYLLFYFAQAPVRQLRRVNAFPDISYGLYLYGWPVQKLLLWNWPGMSACFLFALSLIAGVGLGFLSWNLVEKPSLKLKDFRLGRDEKFGMRAS